MTVVLEGRHGGAGFLWFDSGMGWRELTIPPRSGKSPSYEAVAGIFLLLLSLQTLGSALASADRSRLREGDP